MISQNEYQARRALLAARLPRDAVAVLASAQECTRNGDSHYRFRQDSNFYYLTGFNEPDALLLITSGTNSQSILFNRPRDRAKELWTGRCLGQDDALTQLQMDMAFPWSSMEQELPQFLAHQSCVYFLFGDLRVERYVMDALLSLKAQIRRGTKAADALCDLEPVLSEMRLFKSDAELDLMRKAAQCSVAAHKRAMRACPRMHYEYELEAQLMSEFYQQGCRSQAYDSIVGSGERACVLHYTDNNKALEPGSLVLIDAGAEYENYASDISRTFPVSGQFSPDQKSIYNLVLKAQQAGIAAIKPGLAFNEIQSIMLKILTHGLCALGLLKGAVQDLIDAAAYKPFYMHGSGHWLGLDVHDAGSYKIKENWRPLEAGMVLTVEPGLYISKDTPGVDKRWWGMGVRIEDDVLVTPTGHEVLTADLPVTVDAIEALMRE